MSSDRPEGRDIRAVLFDVEDVIARPDVAEANRRLALLRPGLETTEVQRVRNRPDLYPLWEAYSVGGLGSEAYWAAVLQGLGLAASRPEVQSMIDIQAATAWAEIDAAVLDIARCLRASGRRLGILSNSAPYHDAAIPSFVGAFDMAHFSHRTGRRKPMPEAYHDAAAELGAPPPAILFIDDKLRNVEAAVRVGMVGAHFGGVGALRSALAALGLMDPR